MLQRTSATRRLPAPLLLLLAALLPVSCDRPGPPPSEGQQDNDTYFKEEPEMVEAIRRNNMRLEPTDFLRSRADDPINWQGWSPEIFEHARKEQRLIFTIAGSAEFPETVKLLDILRKRTSLAEELNSSYVCVLADTKAHPELGLQFTNLCAEIQRPISFPVLAWFSHEGCPVAWLPLNSRDVDSFDEVFGTSGVMVSRIWRDSPRYVIVNSARDNEARQERLALEAQEPVEPEALSTSFQSAARSLAALYDPTTGDMDGGGGLVPSGLLRFAGQAGAMETLTGPSAATLEEMTRTVGRKLLGSPMSDPLDGGFFAGRRSRGWAIPHTLKTADTQSLMSIALAQGSASLDEPAFLEGARRTLDFSTRELAGGTDSISAYEVVSDAEISDRAFFWSQEKVRELLSEAEFEVAQSVFALSGLGNIPFESDPRRDYFRKNTLSHARPLEEVATATGKPVEEVRQLLEAACMRLHAQRKDLIARADGLFSEGARITSVNANHAAALATLARYSGDARYHQQALAVLKSIKDQHRAEDGSLLRFAAVEGRRAVAARGEDYASFISALFSVYRNDLDPAHLDEILALTEEAFAQLLDEEGYLRETTVADRAALEPTYSDSMVFGPSTWGTIYGPLERLARVTGDERIREVCTTIQAQLIGRAEENPMIHTDFLVGALVPLADTVVFLKGEPGTPDFDALHRHLQKLEHSAVTLVGLSEGLPAKVKVPADAAPGATVQRGGQTVGTATSVEELARLLSGEGA